MKIELTLNKRRAEPYTHGTGYGHIGAVIADLAAKHWEPDAAGYALAPVKEFKRGDVLLARFFFIQDPGGDEFAVLERHGHCQ